MNQTPPADMVATGEMTHEQIRAMAARNQYLTVTLQKVVEICGDGHPAAEIAKKAIAGKRW